MAIRTLARRPAAASGVEQASVGLAIVAWVLALVGFFPVLYLVATSLKSYVSLYVAPIDQST